MSFLSKLKYYLGMKCIAKYGTAYVVTKRSCGIRVCLGRDNPTWWLKGHWGRCCTFTSLELANRRLNFITEPHNNPQLKPL